MSTASDTEMIFRYIVQCFVSDFLKNKRINTILSYILLLVIPDYLTLHKFFVIHLLWKCGKKNICNAAIKRPHTSEGKCNFWSEVHWFERVALWNIIKEGLKFRKRQGKKIARGVHFDPRAPRLYAYLAVRN